MNEKTRFAERLKVAMIAAGYEARPAVLEREFNLRYWGRPISFQAVRRWLRGESLPEQDKLVVLADWLNLDPQELRFGQREHRVQERQGTWQASVNGEEDVIQAYLSLSLDKRKILREIILTFAKANQR